MKTISIESTKALRASNVFEKTLLICGILSSFWYAAINIIVPSQYPGYFIISQTVSELSAIDAPTRSLWMILCFPFSLLLIAFGMGVWLSASPNKSLRLAAVIIIFDAVFGSFWPPMHKREVIAAGGGTVTDTLHLVWTFIHLVFILLMIWFATAAHGKGFRIYSIATVTVFVVFGILTAIESKGIETGGRTPYVGLWERINMAAYMIWVVVFAIVLLKRNTKTF